MIYIYKKIDQECVGQENEIPFYVRIPLKGPTTT